MAKNSRHFKTAKAIYHHLQRKTFKNLTKYTNLRTSRRRSLLSRKSDLLILCSLDVSSLNRMRLNLDKVCMCVSRFLTLRGHFPKLLVQIETLILALKSIIYTYREVRAICLKAKSY